MFTTLVRPTGEIPVQYIGSLSVSGFAYISWVSPDPLTGLNKPSSSVSHFCEKHGIYYLFSDYPDGCPKCGQNAPEALC